MWTLYIMKDYAHAKHVASDDLLRDAYNLRCKGEPGGNIVAMFLYDDKGYLQEHCFLRA
jgi:hypothetical protein